MNFRLILGGCVFFGLALRLYLIGHAGSVHSDSISYLNIAARHAQGGSVFDPIFPPVFPMCIAWLMPLFDSAETAARILSALAGTLALIPATLLIRQLSNERVALLTAALIVVHPALTHYATYALSESLFTLVLLTVILLAWSCLQRGGQLRFALAGMLCGIAALVRPEGAAYLGLLCLIAVYRLRNREGLPRDLLVSISLAIVAFLIISLPYANYIKAETGSWSISGKTQIMLTKARTVGQAHVDLAVEREQKGSNKPTGPLSEWFGDPLTTMRRVVMNTHLAEKYVVAGLFPPLLLIVTGLGIYFVDWRSRERLFVLACLLPYLPVLLFIVEARIFLPLVPLLLYFAAQGVSTFSDRMTKRKEEGLCRTDLIITLLLILSVLPYTLRPLYRSGENDIYMKAGQWIRESAPGAPRIAFPRSVIGYYAKGQTLPIPEGDVSEILEQLRGDRATHLAVDSRLVATLRPQLIGLLSPEHRQDLLPVHERVDEAGQRLVVYRITHE